MIRLATLVLALAAIALAPIVMRAFDGASDVEVASTASRRRSATEAEVSRLEQQVRNEPQDADALTRLAAVYLQRARETGDPSYYTLADTAVERAGKIAPDSVSALIVEGSLALARHDFERALAIGERARAINPDVVATYGIITDALVELGRYDEALRRWSTGGRTLHRIAACRTSESCMETSTARSKRCARRPRPALASRTTKPGRS
jgi:tetratricopeptide (TPR) repeat protein